MYFRVDEGTFIIGSHKKCRSQFWLSIYLSCINLLPTRCTGKVANNGASCMGSCAKTCSSRVESQGAASDPKYMRMRSRSSLCRIANLSILTFSLSLSPIIYVVDCSMQRRRSINWINTQQIFTEQHDEWKPTTIHGRCLISVSLCSVVLRAHYSATIELLNLVTIKSATYAKNKAL